MRAAITYSIVGSRLLSDPTGQKKVFIRLIEQNLIGKAFISPMLPSDKYYFFKDTVLFGCLRLSFSWGMWDLGPRPGIEPGPPALEVQHFSHWTTREVPMVRLRWLLSVPSMTSIITKSNDYLQVTELT